MPGLYEIGIVVLIFVCLFAPSLIWKRARNVGDSAGILRRWTGRILDGPDGPKGDDNGED